MGIKEEIQKVSEGKYLIRCCIYLRRLINWQGVTYNYNINSCLKSNYIFGRGVDNLLVYKKNFNGLLH